VNPPAYGGGQAYAGGPATRPGQITAVAVIAFVMGAFQLYAAFSNFTVATSIGLYLGFAPGVLYVLAFVNLILAGLLIWGGLTTLQGRTNKILFWTAVAVLVCGVIFNIMVRNYGLLFLPIILPGIILGLLWQQPNKDWFVAQGGTTV
jgi:hypothetical protein